KKKRYAGLSRTYIRCMSGEQITGSLLVALVCLAGGLALYYCGVRWNKSQMKIFGVALAAMPLIALGFRFGIEWLGGESEYRTVGEGAEQGQSVVTTEVGIPITNGAVEHQIEMTAKISGDKYTSEPTHLVYKVKTPTGEMVAEGEHDAAPTNTFRWAPIT